AFTPGALQAAAEVALDRKTGARALRSIVEESLLEVMYDIPERTEIRKCIITEETIREGPVPVPPAELDDEEQAQPGSRPAPVTLIHGLLVAALAISALVLFTDSCGGG